VLRFPLFALHLFAFPPCPPFRPFPVPAFPAFPANYNPIPNTQYPILNTHHPSPLAQTLFNKVLNISADLNINGLQVKKAVRHEKDTFRLRSQYNPKFHG